MKKILSGIAFVIAAAFLTSSMAMATTACATLPGNYGAYYPGPTTCSINALTFSNFQFNESSGGGATAPTPASVGVVVETSVGNEGFRFDPGFNEAQGQTQDVTVGFLVTAAPGTMIDDVFIAFNGASSNGGSTSFTETFCDQGFLTGNCGQVSINSGTINEEVGITPTDHLYVTKDMGANCGSNETCTATVSAVTNEFSNTSAIPEPASLSMMGLGLLGLGLIGRRKRKV